MNRPQHKLMKVGLEVHNARKVVKQDEFKKGNIKTPNTKVVTDRPWEKGTIGKK